MAIRVRSMATRVRSMATRVRWTRTRVRWTRTRVRWTGTRVRSMGTRAVNADKQDITLQSGDYAVVAAGAMGAMAKSRSVALKLCRWPSHAHRTIVSDAIAVARTTRLRASA
jgi:hypothetical protein